MIWFSADTHLGHVGILTHQPMRQFANIEEMDTCIIDAFNAVVRREDELWLLGDFAWRASKYGHYRQRLNVRKLHIIAGNHDSPSLRQYVSSMHDMVCRKFCGIKFHLTHYPMVSWRARNYGSVHLYGHCHGSMEAQLNSIWPNRHAMDVGIDCAFKRFGEWRPFSFNEIKIILAGSN